MAQRSYVLAKIEGTPDRQAMAQLVARLEELDEVAFAEPVVGEFDLLIILDTAKPLEMMFQKLETVKSLRGLVGLKANPIPPRGRMNRNLEKIPAARQ